ncbi:MAG: tetraacyldisaccharide 4'-kinase [Pirellulales bacterium]|nr:tetraacyldisaccharide 4'-kinase [Pirellulales bacterium]
MLDPQEFQNIISGRRRGWGGTLWRTGFALAEWPYAIAMRLRNLAYDLGVSRISRVEVPVISVGNLTLGGTGKTPCVAWLARWFRERNVRVAIISRGYGAGGDSRNDEARELEEQLPDVPHLQNPDRVAAALLAIEEFGTQLLILDDAYQHRRIARDLNLLIVDATDPYGSRHVFPRGMLREPLSGASRAQAILLTKADQVPAETRKNIARHYQALAPHAIWCETRHQPLRLLRADGQTADLKLLNNQSVGAICAIGNPAAFRQTLIDCHAHVRDMRIFPDHHRYTRADVESLGDWASQLDLGTAGQGTHEMLGIAGPASSGTLVCTHKDLVKLGMTELGGKPLWALAIGLEFLSGEEELLRLLEPLVERITASDDPYAVEDGL